MRNIILASGSPRRQQLLQQMGVVFDVIPSDFDEYLDHTMPATALTIALGLGKVRTVAAAHPDAFIVGGDTIVTLNGKHLGKAASEAEAREVLLAHSGQTVTVTTSIILACKELGLEDAGADETKIFCNPADPDAIEAYLRTGDWKDKAGSWGINSGGAFMIDRVEGEYDTVLGLPSKILVDMFAKQGVTARPIPRSAIQLR